MACKKADNIENNCPDKTQIVGLINGVGQDNPCGVRYSDKNRNEGDRSLFDNYWRDIINRSGALVDYYVHTFNKDGEANKFLGEHTTQKFSGPHSMIIGVNLEEGAIGLREFGWDPEDDVTLFIHIKSFKQHFVDKGDKTHEDMKDYIEPKSGDVFTLTEFGCSAPGIRTPQFYEVTNRRDSDISNDLNILGGHYVWKLTAKRLDYSWQPGLPDTARGHTIYDQEHHGRMEGDPTATPPIVLDSAKTPNKVIRKDRTDIPSHYDFDTDKSVKEQVYDKSDEDSDIFGRY